MDNKSNYQTDRKQNEKRIANKGRKITLNYQLAIEPIKPLFKELEIHLAESGLGKFTF